MIIKLPLKTPPKKNSEQIVYKNGRPIIIQSQRYLNFERECGYFLNSHKKHIDYPVNLKVIFYTPDKRKKDIVNLLNAIQDVLVKYEVLEDDNYNIVASVDGSRIIYEKGREETIIEITKLEEDK